MASSWSSFGSLRGANLGRVMLQPMATTTLCVAAIRLASSGPSVRIGEPLVVALDLIEVADVLRRGDDRGDRPVVLGCRTEIRDLHPVGARGGKLEVFFDRVRRGEVPIGTHAKPEMRLGRRYAICLLLSSRIDGEDDQGEREKDSPGAHARIITDGRSAPLPRPVRSGAYRDDGRRG